MRRPLFIAAATVVVLVSWWALTPGRDEAPRPAPEPTAPENGEPAAMKDGGPRTSAPLVVHVKTSDGSPVPAGTQAGFSFAGSDPRMRAVSAGGDARFSDVPLGRVRAVADAPGYVAAPADVIVTAGMTNEVVVLLTPKSADGTR